MESLKDFIGPPGRDCFAKNHIAVSGGFMPFINVKVAGKLSVHQKKDIAERFTNILSEVAGKSPSSTYIVFEEVEKENWAVGDRLLSE